MVRRTLLAAGKSVFTRLYILNGISVNNYMFNNSQIFHNGLVHVNEPPSIYKMILVSSSNVLLLVIYALNVIISRHTSSLQIVVLDHSTRQLSVLLQCGRLLACSLARHLSVTGSSRVVMSAVCHLSVTGSSRVVMSAVCHLSLLQAAVVL